MANTEDKTMWKWAALFATLTLAMVWRFEPERASTGRDAFIALVCGVLTAECVRRAVGESPDAPRSSKFEVAVGLVEGSAYIIGGMAGLTWLIRLALGRAEPPDEVERTSVAILALIGAALGIAGIVHLVRRLRRSGAEVDRRSTP
jgi:hypothetical protein